MNDVPRSTDRYLHTNCVFYIVLIIPVICCLTNATFKAPTVAKKTPAHCQTCKKNIYLQHFGSKAMIAWWRSLSYAAVSWNRCAKFFSALTFQALQGVLGYSPSQTKIRNKTFLNKNISHKQAKQNVQKLK